VAGLVAQSENKLSGRISAGTRVNSSRRSPPFRPRPRQRPVWSLAVLNNCCTDTSLHARPFHQSPQSISCSLDASTCIWRLSSSIPLLHPNLDPDANSASSQARTADWPPAKGLIVACWGACFSISHEPGPRPPLPTICLGCALVRPSSQWIACSAT
jgi:hypothetical protein